MKMRNVLLTTGLLFAFLTIAYAAGIDGKWTAEVPGRNGTNTTTFTLKASGEKLEGTVSGRMGDAPISDGTIKGNDVSFAVVRDTPNGKFTIKYVGKLAGDELKLTMTREGGQGGGQGVEITAKRAS